MKYRIKQLEHFCDQHKTIFDFSTNPEFYKECKNKSYYITSHNEDIINSNYISIYQDKNSDLKLIKLLKKLLINLKNINIIKINSLFKTCFGLNEKEIISLLVDTPNIKIINLREQYSKRKITTKYLIDLVIIIKKPNLPYFNNLRVGDTIIAPNKKTNIYLFNKIDDNCIHPFYLATKTYLKSKNKNKVFKIFEEYRKACILNNSNEALGLNNYNVFKNSNSLYDTILPWTNMDRKNYYKLHKEWAIEKNILFKLNRLENFGSIHCTSRKSAIETNRICNIIDGYLNGSLDIENPNLFCSLYLKNNDFIVSAKDGNHRSAVLAALGINKIPYKIREVVKFDELNNWRHVKSNLYSNVAAEKVFNNIFYSKPRKYHSKWKDIVQKSQFIN